MSAYLNRYTLAALWVLATFVYAVVAWTKQLRATILVPDISPAEPPGEIEKGLKKIFEQAEKGKIDWDLVEEVRVLARQKVRGERSEVP